MIDILSLNPEELTEFIIGLNEPKFRSQQVFNWLHVKKESDFSSMGNLPLSLRKKLESAAVIPTAKQKHKLESSCGTSKYVFDFNDALVESVYIPNKTGITVCVSTQAGCKMGCLICASGKNGFTRNLTPGEMCAQVYAADNPKSIVLMGSGEPLDNFENVIKFIDLISHPSGLNIGSRHITLSTCGLIPEIKRLEKMNKQITLAISLHASNQKTRESLMPIAKKYTLSDLTAACFSYSETTKRRVSFEYCLIHEVNNKPQDAKELCRLLKGMLCHVNIIELNNNSSAFKKSLKQDTEEFKRILEENNIPVSIRKSKGSEIQAACGQLINIEKGI